MSLLMVMAGGTGGHVYPALAVADELRGRGVDIVWLGTRSGLEARAVPKAGIEVEWISIQGLRGKGITRWILMPWLLARAVFQAHRIIVRRKPDAMLGMGGFVSGPGAIAARLTGRPLVIHEQNAIGGMTNNLLRRFAQKVLTGFPSTFEHAEHVGNPVREAFFGDSKSNTAGQRLNLLVVGGSQGAARLNEVVPEALGLMQDEVRPVMRHQCGRDRATAVVARYERLGIAARADEFIEDMASAYREADLVICRAGAMTVAEVAASGTPAIFVPYPHAVSDHQSANARHLVNTGGARLLPEAELTPQSLADMLNELEADRGRLADMSKSAVAFARPEATKRVADVCEEVLHA